MELGLTDKVVIVAASSEGLGKACALQFAQEGAQVIICGRHQDRLQAALDELNAVAKKRAVAIPADMTRADDIERLAGQVVDEFGSVHVLVNNAGGPPPGGFDEFDDADWQGAFELSLLSGVRLARAVLPCMRAQRWGRIANITSMTVKQPLAELLLSNSLRLGVVGWAKTLANQLAEENVLINNICPGWTRTARIDQLLQGRAQANGSSVADEEHKLAALIPMRRLGKPEEFANLVVFLCSERASYITGAAVSVDGGATAGYY